MNVFLCQLDIAWEDKAANFARVRRLIGAARPPRGALFVLPEMFATGFSRNVAVTRQAYPPESEYFLSELTRDHGVHIVAGVVTRDASGADRNEAVMVTPGGQVAARYAKMRPFSLAGEPEIHQPGQEVVVGEWQGFRVGLFVCYDLRFPELFREAARRGANLFVVIANWPARRQQHWLTLLQARAIENQAYVVGVNRCGRDPEHAYPGRSVVVDPHGVIIADAGEQERVLGAQVELGEMQAWRRDFPALRDAGWS